MKQGHLTRILSAMLAILTLLVSIPATTVTALSDGEAIVDGAVENESATNGDGSVSTESNTEGSQSAQTQEGSSAAGNKSFVEFANSLANGVNAYFDNGNRDHFYVKNQNMTLEYNLGALDDKRIGYIKNTKGELYFEEAMDVYVKMEGINEKLYSKDSVIKSGTNMDMFGYYYYQVTFEDQEFVTKFTETTGSKKITEDIHSAYGSADEMTVEKTTADVIVKDFYKNEVEDLGNTNIIKATFTSTSDPKISLKNQVYVKDGATDYDYLKITMRSGTEGTLGSRSVQIFYWTTNNPGNKEAGSKYFSFNEDGEFHDYYFYLGGNTQLFAGDFKGARFDFTGKVGDTIEIANIELVNSAVENNPDQLLLKRYFGVYSDKMNHRVQITTKQHTNNIEEIGLETRLPVSDISKLIVKDASGTHDTIEGVDWNTAEYIGFDTLVGIFGYILHPDVNDGVMDGKNDTKDKFEVTVEYDEEKKENVYVITQSNKPVGIYREYNAAVSLGKISGVTVTFADGTSVASADYEGDSNVAKMKACISGITEEKMKTAEKVTLHIDDKDHVLYLAPYVHPYANGDETLSKGLAALTLNSEKNILNVRYSYQVVDEPIRNASTITELTERQALAEGTIFTSSYYSRLTASETTFYDRYLTHPGMRSNENDFYMSQRLYTDENHDFAAFIREAEIERNPLKDEDFIIDAKGSTLEEAFGQERDGVIGYDPWMGAYYLQLDGEGFNTPQYDYPNRHWNIRFKVNSPDKRNIYVFAYVDNGGCLECAAILDENNMMLPIPLEVAKNFSEGGGERDIFNVEDYTYSYTIFPMNLEEGETEYVNLVNIQQNWGNYPNKQISSIQFHCPYYHLSTGTTESNCIVPWYTTERARGLSTLPDHRGWSGPFWQSQPQHNSCGSHRWLTYTNSDGKYCASETTSTSVGSFGPIYADLNMDYITDDGAFRVHYNHMEMPQQDENRGYYEMQYTVLHDVTFTNMKSDFEFLSFTDNDSTGVYKRIGYLGTDGKSQYVRNNYINYVGDVGSDDELTPIYAAYKLNPNATNPDDSNKDKSDKYLKVDGTATGYPNQAAIIPTEVTVEVVGDELVYTPVEAYCELAKNGKGYTFYNVNTDEFAYYTLGTYHPYFSFFDMDNNSSTVNSNADGKRDGYGNLAFIVKDYSISFQNYSEAPAFAIKNGNNRIALTLDAEEITLKAGDTITINAIVMPWGSQEMETYEEYWANDNNDATVDWDYEDVINDNGELYLDKNVRDVRLDSCINYYKATSTTDTVLDSPFLAEIESKDGESATFTLSGGNNHMAVRVYGFDKLTVPTIYEIFEGGRKEYKVSSLDNPDAYGYGYAYDGYSVYRDVDKDGNVTYSYAFIVDMTDATSRTFRVEASEEFTGWEKLEHVITEEPLRVVYTPEKIAETGKSGVNKDKIERYDANGELVTGDTPAAFIRLYAQGKNENGTHKGESTFSMSNSGGVETGKYFVIKYRLPETNVGKGSFQVYAETEGTGAGGGTAVDYVTVHKDYIFNDGKWKLLIIDMESYIPENFKSRFADYEQYFARYARVDFFNGTTHTANDYIDIEYACFAMDVDELLAADRESVFETEIIDYALGGSYSNAKAIRLNTYDGNIIISPSEISNGIGSGSGIAAGSANVSEELTTDAELNNMPYLHLVNKTVDGNGDRFNVIMDLSQPLDRAGAFIGVLYKGEGITLYYLDENVDVSSYDNYRSFGTTTDWTFAVQDFAPKFDVNIGARLLRIDYLEGKVENSTTDIAFIGLFDSRESAETYYAQFQQTYFDTHTHMYGEYEPHALGETVEYRYCVICGEVDEVTREAACSFGDWSEHTIGNNNVYRYCIACGKAESGVVDCTFGEWSKHTIDNRNVNRYCTVCGKEEKGVAECTYSPWEHVQGQVMETCSCTICGEEKTRATAITGWMSLADYRDRDGNNEVDDLDHLRNSVSDTCQTVSAASYPIAYSESKGGYYLDINGEWLAINDGVNRYVYRIDDGEWIDFANQSTKTTAWSEEYHYAINSANVDVDRSYYHGSVPSNTVLFNDYVDQTVSLTIGIVPEGNQSVTIPLITYTDIKGPESYTEGIQFAFDGKNYVVMGYNGSETDVKIPGTYHGAPVIAIVDGGFANTAIESVTIPASVTNVGSKVFEGCADLTTVTVADGNAVYYSEGNSIIRTDDKTLIAGTAAGNIPEGVVSVAAGAFAGTGATKIALPASVTSLDLTAFEGCEISEITVAEGNSVYTAENNCLMVGTTVILGCKGCTAIPAGVEVIGNGAFAGTGITSLTLPVSLKAIEAKAFDGCANLTVNFEGTGKLWENVALADDFAANVVCVEARLGDINADGVIDDADTTEIRKYIASKDPATGEATYVIDISLADMNKDGKITTVDLLRHRRMVAEQP